MTGAHPRCVREHLPEEVGGGSSDPLPVLSERLWREHMECSGNGHRSIALPESPDMTEHASH